jgi:hypothetical protein
MTNRHVRASIAELVDDEHRSSGLIQLLSLYRSQVFNLTS